MLQPAYFTQTNSLSDKLKVLLLHLLHLCWEIFFLRLVELPLELMKYTSIRHTRSRRWFLH